MLPLRIATVLLVVAATSGMIQYDADQPMNSPNRTFLVFLGEWSSCGPLSPKVEGGRRFKSDFRRSNSLMLYHLPKIGIKHRIVQCKENSGNIVEQSFCGGELVNVATKSLCILRVDCKLGAWSEWQTDHSTGGRIRRRNVLVIPQGDGKQCGAVEERKPLNEDEGPRWWPGNWGPCIVAGDRTGVVEEAIWSVWGAGVSSGECGGGEQRRPVSCVGRSGRPLPDAACYNQTVPVVRQPCEVSCPSECLMGPWSEWSGCKPIGGCPMYPVQELTAIGYSIRTRRALESDLDTGAMCGPLEEGRACASPRCAIWEAGRWDFCELQDRQVKCGSGVRHRQLRCVDHNGEVAPEEWCAWSGAGLLLSRTEPCRIACPGDCVLSRWGNWSECSATCALPHEQPPQRTRQRFIVGHASSDGWPCPPPEQLIQTEICNNHACHAYSWMTLPWGSCQQRNLDKIKITANITKQFSEECPEDGVQTREVWCLQDHDKIVQDSLCASLTKPVKEQTCKLDCPLDCNLGEWTEWSPCPTTCESASQVRVRKVEGGRLCGAPLERRICPLASDCSSAASTDAGFIPLWQAGRWQSCVTLPDNENGLQVRGFWCSFNKHRVDASRCAGSIAPVAVRTCTTFNSASDNDHCRIVCNDPHASEDDERDGCVCDGYSLQVLPPSDCILPKSSQNGVGRKLRAVVCRGPGDEFLHTDICRRNIELKSLEKLQGYDWDQEFPDLLSTSCFVPKPQDCELGPWSEWGLCNLGIKTAYMRRRAVSEGSVGGVLILATSLNLALGVEATAFAEYQKARRHFGDTLLVTIHTDGFRNRNRTLLRQQKHGGRVCGSTMQTLACKVEFARWEVSEWGPCIALQPPCGYAFTNRTVRCVGSSSPHGVNESHCNGNKPTGTMRCRAPCPNDCVMSPWSEWSPCQSTNNIGRQDRTRNILRPASQDGTSCGRTIQSQSCLLPSEDQKKYAWTFTEWDDCQPLGGSPCGEGTKHRTIRCKNDVDEYVDDYNCRDVTPSGDLRDWCYISCTANCEMTAWGPWDLSQCACGLQDTYAIRNRTTLVEPAGDGRICGDTSQTIPCPIQPCAQSIASIHQPDISGCLFQITDKYVDGMLSVCGHGAKPSCGSLADDRIGRFEQWRCHPVASNEVFVPTVEPEDNACVINCECKGGMTGPWSDWGLCINSARSRKRITTPCNAHTRFEIVEYMNCTDVEEMDSYENDDELDRVETLDSVEISRNDKTNYRDAPRVDYLPNRDGYSLIAYYNIRFGMILLCFVVGSSILYFMLSCVFSQRSDKV